MRRRRFVAAALAAALGAFVRPDDAEAAPRRRKAAGAGKKSTAKKPGKPAPQVRPQVAEEPEVREVAIPWRNYELTTTVTLPAGKAPLRVWLPLPLTGEPAWQRSVEHSWTCNADQYGIISQHDGELQAFYAEWKDGARAPQLRLTSSIETCERQFDVTRRNPLGERPDVLRRNLRSSPRLPTDGLVRSTAERIIGRIKDPVAQGKALYDWVAERTVFDSQAAGTGRGDILALIERPETPGRCADINGLFVALARSIGLPARLTFGQRIDQSLIVASLGQRGELAGAQHCRAEFHAPGYGWIPVDPADVRKALAEDRSTLDGMKGTVLRKLLFGFWEPNWIALNRAHDVALRHAEGQPLAVFTTPYVEIAGQAVNLDAGSGVTLTARRGQDST